MAFPFIILVTAVCTGIPISQFRGNDIDRLLQLKGAAHPVDVFYASASRFITAFSSLSMTAPHS